MTVILKTCYTMFTGYRINITSNFSVSVSNEKLKFKSTKTLKLNAMYDSIKTYKIYRKND